MPENPRRVPKNALLCKGCSWKREYHRVTGLAASLARESRTRFHYESEKLTHKTIVAPLLFPNPKSQVSETSK